jgi:predicted metal-dependent phosphotriesterase family hydrolase
MTGATVDTARGAIVDRTVVGLGPYIPRIARIAAETELNIVVTGLYTHNDVPMYFHYLGPGGALGGAHGDAHRQGALTASVRTCLSRGHVAD